MANLKLIVGSFCLLGFLTYATGLRIGAFNIQVFGKSKASKDDVMKVLVRIISRYDLVLIQEIRDSEGKAIVKLLDKVNEMNSANPFSMKLSPRLGRTTSKEQYAFFYREGSGLNVADDRVYTDTNDEFEREPYIVSFTSSKAKPEAFTIAGIHVDPDDAVEEIAKLSDVFRDMEQNAENVMVMGDLNADCSYVPNYRWEEIPLRSDGNYHWPIHDEQDTTVSATNCAYDRFIYTGEGFRKGIKIGSATVFKFDDEYNMEIEDAKDVSDHYPIELELKDGVSKTGFLSASGLLVFVGLLGCVVLYR